MMYYKGYNYDRLVNRFLLRDFSLNRETFKCFPEENWSEVYRCLGAKDASSFFENNNSAETTDQLLASVPFAM